MAILSPKEKKSLELKFLYHLIKIYEETLQTSVKADDIWNNMQMFAFNKEKVLPFIIHSLEEEGLITKGDKSDEVKIVRSRKDKVILFLDILNSIVNGSENATIPVVLNVQGSVIMGDMISRKRYYKEMSEFLNYSNPSFGQEFSNIFNSLISTLPHNEIEEEVYSSFIGIKLICLKNTRYVLGSDDFLPTEGYSFWMGKIVSPCVSNHLYLDSD